MPRRSRERIRKTVAEVERSAMARLSEARPRRTSDRELLLGDLARLDGTSAQKRVEVHGTGLARSPRHRDVTLEDVSHAYEARRANEELERERVAICLTFENRKERRRIHDHAAQ